VFRHREHGGAATFTADESMIASPFCPCQTDWQSQPAMGYARLISVAGQT
jgi:hypothetical protein